MKRRLVLKKLRLPGISVRPKRGTMFAIALLASCLLGGCATRYASMGQHGREGYSSQQIGPGEYLVDFKGNGYTSPERVLDFALLRAADLALSDRANWFTVENFVSTSSATRYTTPIHFYRRPEVMDSSGPGMEATALMRTEPEERVFYRPGVQLRIRLHSLLPGTGFPYEPQLLRDELLTKYGLD